MHREDGSVKLRAVDHFSWSAAKTRSRKKRKLTSVNGCTAMPEKMKHDHLDELCAAAAMFIMFASVTFGACRCDVDISASAGWWG